MDLEKNTRLFNTLANLHLNKQLDEISISELTEQAQVSRMYFYRNFTTYKDIIDQHITELLNHFLRITTKRNNLTIETTAVLFFETLQFDAKSLTVFLNNGETEWIEHDFEIGLGKLIEDGVVQGSNDKYWRAYTDGGLSRVITIWLQSNTQESPKVMGKKISQIILQNQFLS